MNLEKMFEMQKVLDDRIIEEKGLQGQDLLPNLILALQVELAECANEWRGFKHWSNNREPRTKHPLEVSPNGAFRKGGNPLLEEYVDCLHFILSIGNLIKYDTDNALDLEGAICEPDITTQFIAVFDRINTLSDDACDKSDLTFWLAHNPYESLFQFFNGIGKMLGFTPEQIEAAYMEKNAVNHQRQQEGY
ncbi:dUTP diphosphatase [Bacillus atrophaeus]|uniref:dUTP diphosphatase n=1 Tax=Bacillus atrophaeus TaxID=1452 RepID=UPI000779B85F|nr:dUTP diphosphatase [Bacillus atrophaeus]KYD05338.1 Dimeric dUTPase [Bacillus atrophaeus]